MIQSTIARKMSDEKIHIAVVRSESTIITDGEYNVDRRLAKKVKENDKYKNVTLELVAWDSPIDWEKFTHIFLGIGIEYIENVEKWLSWLNSLPPNISKRVFNSPSIIRWNMDKKYLLEMQEAGIPIPPTLFLNKETVLNGEETMKKLKSQTNRKITTVVLKNMMDAGGLSAKKIELEKPDLISEKETLLIQEMLDKADEYGLIIQNFISTIQSEGEWSCVYFDRKLSHCAIKRPDVNDFRVQLMHGGSIQMVKIEEVPKTVLELSQRVIDFVPKNENLLYARVDIIRDEEDNAVLMELEAFEPDLYIIEDHAVENFLNAITNPKYKF